MNGTNKKVEPEFYKADTHDKDGNRLKELYVKVQSDSPGEEAYDKNGNKLNGIFKQLELDVKVENGN